MADSASEPPATTDGWKHTGVRVIPSDQLDSNTAQTPGIAQEIYITLNNNANEFRHVPSRSHKLRSSGSSEALGWHCYQ